jgi:hypothetical protein
MLIKISDSLRCPELLEIFQTGIQIGCHRCELPKGHPGLHRCAVGAWAEQSKIQSIIENEGRSL